MEPCRIAINLLGFSFEEILSSNCQILVEGLPIGPNSRSFTYLDQLA